MQSRRAFSYGKTSDVYANRLANCAELCYYFVQRREAEEMPQIRPITDLRKTTEMSEICHAKKEPVFITKNGYGDLVLMSVETYDEMIGIAGADRAISEAEKEFSEEGILLDAKESLKSLRRHYFG